VTTCGARSIGSHTHHYASCFLDEHATKGLSRARGEPSVYNSIAPQVARFALQKRWVRACVLVRTSWCAAHVGNRTRTCWVEASRPTIRLHEHGVGGWCWSARTEDRTRVAALTTRSTAPLYYAGLDHLEEWRSRHLPNTELITRGTLCREHRWCLHYAGSSRHKRTYTNGRPQAFTCTCICMCSDHPAVHFLGGPRQAAGLYVYVHLHVQRPPCRAFSRRSKKKTGLVSYH
jgi:hypothetical protein